MPTLGPVRGMGPTSEAKWEGWSEAEGLRRESSRPPGGSVADSAGKAVGWPDADQGANQGADQGADQGAGQGADQGADQRCGQKMRTGLHFWCARP